MLKQSHNPVQLQEKKNKLLVYAGEMKSCAEVTASSAAEKTSKASKKKAKATVKRTSYETFPQESSSKKKDKKVSSKERSKSSTANDVQQAVIRQQQEVKAGVALLAERFRAGLYFWPLVTHPVDRTGTGDRFSAQDVILPLPSSGGEKLKKERLPLLSRSSDNADADEDEGGHEVAVVDQNRDYVAQARADAAALARQFWDGLLEEEGEQERVGARRQQQLNRGHRGRLPRLANAERTITVYRLQDVISQRERGSMMTTTTRESPAATVSVSAPRPVQCPSSLLSSASSTEDDDGARCTSRASPPDVERVGDTAGREEDGQFLDVRGCKMNHTKQHGGRFADAVGRRRDADQEQDEQVPDGDEGGGPAREDERDSDNDAAAYCGACAKDNKNGSEEGEEKEEEEELDFGFPW